MPMPMADTQGELQAQLEAARKREAELSAELLEVQREAKRARKREGKARRRESGGDSKKEQHVAQLLHQAGVDEVVPELPKGIVPQLLVLMNLACVDLVVSFVLGQGRPAKFSHHLLGLWDTDTRRTIAHGLRTWYLTVDFDLVVAALDGPQALVAMLCKYAVEYHLWQWLLDLNCRKGVKPESTQLLAKACTLIPADVPADVSEQLQSFFQNSNNGGRTRRKWIASFRKRWGVKPGLLKVGEDLKPGEMQKKAPLLLAGPPGVVYLLFCKGLSLSLRGS